MPSTTSCAVRAAKSYGPDVRSNTDTSSPPKHATARVARWRRSACPRAAAIRPWWSATITRRCSALADAVFAGRQERRLYRQHRWRSEGFHGEAKTWHGLARAVRRGLQNMRIQSFLTAAAINLKRLAAALLGLLRLLQQCLPYRLSLQLSIG